MEESEVQQLKHALAAAEKRAEAAKQRVDTTEQRAFSCRTADRENDIP